MTEKKANHERWEFEADSSDAAKRGILAILRSVTATIAEMGDDDTRYEFEIEIRERET